jgi:hypothetical protein
MRYLLVFVSTHLALKAETYLKRDQVPFKLRMKPRTISAECGLAIELPTASVREALRSLQRRELEGIAIYVQREGAEDWEEMTPAERSWLLPSR